MTKLEIEINDLTDTKKLFYRVFIIVLLVIAPVSLGAVLGSLLLQIIGFICGTFVAVKYADNKNKSDLEDKQTFKSFDEAINHLQDLKQHAQME